MKWIVLALLAATACGEPMCKRECEKTRDQLIRDFGVPKVDCNDSKWNTDDCNQCDEVYRHDYGVVLTGGGACTVLAEPMQTP
jgi:hypothetical protein